MQEQTYREDKRVQKVCDQRLRRKTGNSLCTWAYWLWPEVRTHSEVPVQCRL